jgi:hypothetical protein
LRDLGQVADLLEAELLVQAQRRRILGVDAGDDRVHALRARPLEELLDQAATDASPPRRRGHIDRVLDRQPVSGPGSEGAVAGEGQDGAVLTRHDHGMPLRAATVEHLPLARERHRPFAEHGRRGRDHVVVDGDDPRQIGLDGVVDLHRRVLAHASARSG